MTVAINEDAAGVFWSWNHSRTELQELTSEQQREIEEASSAAEAKVRSFTQARQAVEAKSLSRGFYPFAPHLKGKKGKGKRFGKSKGNSKSKMTSMSSRPSPPVLDSAEAFAVGCFTEGRVVDTCLGVHDASFNIVLVHVWGFSLCARCLEIQVKLQPFTNSPTHQFTNAPMLPPQGEEDW